MMESNADSPDDASKRYTERNSAASGEGTIWQCTPAYVKTYPYKLMEVVYGVQLCMLVESRIELYRRPQTSVSFTNKDWLISAFNSMVIYLRIALGFACSFHVKIIHDQTDKRITHAMLSDDEDGLFSLKKYFNSYVEYKIKKPFVARERHVVIFTNALLDLTENLSVVSSDNMNAPSIQFRGIEFDGTYEFLKDYLCPDTGHGKFYRLSNRNETIKLFKFSSDTRKLMRDCRSFLCADFERTVQDEFYEKLVFAVGQPDREKLRIIVSREVESQKLNFNELQGKNIRGANHPVVSSTTWQLQLFSSIAIDMFQNAKITGISTRNVDINSDIMICYKNNVTRLSVLNAIQKRHTFLFSSHPFVPSHSISLNECFTQFIIESFRTNNLKFFVVYTNRNVELLFDEDTYVCFNIFLEPINAQKKRYKVLKYCSCINEENAMKFRQSFRDFITVNLTFPSLKFKLSDERKIELKEQFFHKFIVAVSQPTVSQLNRSCLKLIQEKNGKFDDDEIQEIVLRWSESRKYNYLTIDLMQQLLDDIRNDRSSNNDQ